MVEQFYTLRGLKIFTKIMGEGEPIIFLHGGPGGEHRYFLPHLEPLSRSFQLIFYDQRGCGQSEVPTDKETLTMDVEVETLEALRVELAIDKLNLMGESWGSMLALLYASKYPHNVNKLFLTAAVGATTEGYEGFSLALENRFSKEEKERVDSIMEKLKRGEVNVEELFLILDPYYVYSIENLSKKTKTSSNAEVNRLIGKDIVENYNHSVQPEKLKNIPIFIAQGERDIITPDDIERLLVKYIPHAKVISIEECGHWSVIEKPDVLEQLIKKFFL